MQLVMVRLNIQHPEAWSCLSFLCHHSSTKQKSAIMGMKTVLLVTVGVLAAYYVYTPFPDNIEEPWKLMAMTAQMKVIGSWVSSRVYPLCEYV